MDELRDVLELATDEELRDLTQILFQRRFNPLDYVQTPDPLDVQSRDRQEWLDAIDQRFRYLAADGLTVLQGRANQISYRQVLIQVCRYLRLPYSASLSTTALEEEIFLYLLSRTWDRLPAAEQKALAGRVQASLAQTSLAQELPLPVQQNPLSLIAKGGSALAVSSVLRPFLLQQIARQFAIHFATYQIAQDAMVKGGAAAATQLQNYVTMQMARRGMAIATARYGAMRTVFAFLGPALWTWFLADLGWRAISTNYARVIPTVFALAQIRLMRTAYSEAA